MCLGLPGRVIEILPGGDVARVEVSGVVREIDIGMLDGPFITGDYILVHSGFAVERMSADEARDALDVFADSLGTDGEPPAEGHVP